MDIIGSVFGKWTVLEKSINHKRPYMYLCLCECGNKKNIDKYKLINGKAKSCGCIRRKKMIGMRFGRWTVLEHSEKTNKSYEQYWLCGCDCGNERNVSGHSLRSGTSKSCGCFKSDVQKKRLSLEFGKASFNALYQMYRRNAKNRGLDFEIDKEYFKYIVSLPCNYCGRSSANEYRVGVHSNGSYKYNGIDRVNNSKGYVKENIVPCCKWCNLSKLDRDESEFLNWITEIYNHAIIKKQNETT